MPTPIFNDEWDQIDNFIQQNEEYYRVQGIIFSNTKHHNLVTYQDTEYHAMEQRAKEMAQRNTR